VECSVCSTNVEKWIRCYEESWFDENYERDDNQIGIPAIGLGFRPAGDLHMIPELCDYAIEAVAYLAKLAKESESKLAEAKKEAEKQIQQKSRDG
jgi:hypothetical protein